MYLTHCKIKSFAHQPDRRYVTSDCLFSVLGEEHFHDMNQDLKRYCIEQFVAQHWWPLLVCICFLRFVLLCCFLGFLLPFYINLAKETRNNQNTLEKAFHLRILCNHR